MMMEWVHDDIDMRMVYGGVYTVDDEAAQSRCSKPREKFLKIPQPSSSLPRVGALLGVQAGEMPPMLGTRAANCSIPRASALNSVQGNLVASEYGTGDPRCYIYRHTRRA